MIAVKVEYTVALNFVEENKENIRRVMDALQKNPVEGMYYSSQVLDDNPNTFVHINMAEDGETMSRLNDMQEFKDFQSALKASQPLAPPKLTKMTVVGKGF